VPNTAFALCGRDQKDYAEASIRVTPNEFEDAIRLRVQAQKGETSTQTKRTKG
jgi:hypothetical protein